MKGHHHLNSFEDGNFSHYLSNFDTNRQYSITNEYDCMDTITNKNASVGNRQHFLDIFAESVEIKTHSEFLTWNQEKLQEFLPHEVMIAAWGDFSLGIIYYEIISSTPGICTNIMQENEMASFLKRLYSYWISNDRNSSQLISDHSVIRCRDIQDGQLKSSMQNMKTALIHAIKDVRGGSDSFYVLLSSNTDIHPDRRKIFHQLLPYIDATLRQIAPPSHPTGFEQTKPLINGEGLKFESVLKLSDRESEIMECVCSGKTNVEIGLILNISTFTVKNHLQHIFKKLNVVNRSQAVAEFRCLVSSICSNTLSYG